MDTSTYADRVLDYGDQACGRIVEDIVDAMQNLAPGQKLLIIASDPSVSVDIMAWCRRTGNPLLRTPAKPLDNQYLIQKLAES